MKPSIGILDCGSGNLRSVEKAFRHQGSKPEVSGKIELEWDGLVLPGVGAFGHAMANLEKVRDDIITYVETGKPFLGICLGLQVLFESSEEDPDSSGLGLIKGQVVRIRGNKVPHMGWNSLDIKIKSKILNEIKTGEYLYFVHSYHGEPEEEVTVASCRYQGQDLTACLERDNIHACQFHPEKSGVLGLRIISNFVEISSGGC